MSLQVHCRASCVGDAEYEREITASLFFEVTIRGRYPELKTPSRGFPDKESDMIEIPSGCFGSRT